MLKIVWLFVSSLLLLAGQEQGSRGYRAIVESKDQSVLSSELAAKVIKLPIYAGESFHEGDVLVQYDCSVITTQKEKVQAELSGLQAKAQAYERMVKLNAMGELDATMATADKNQKEAELKIMSLTASKCELKAPYDGKVMKLLVHEHEYVGEQKELMEIVGTKRLSVKIVIPTKMLAMVKRGQKIYFFADETGSRAEGIVVGINPAADPVSQTIQIWATLTKIEPYIFPGIVGHAEFLRP
jgi:RND family efflux transporter MFP subunit